MNGEIEDEYHTNMKKALAREREKKKERIKVLTQDHTRNCRTHNGEYSLREENTKLKT
jgi:hypothetical protein